MEAGDCGVCIYSEGDDNAAFCDARVVTARKPHRCCECRETIPVGERYERTAGKWDGTVSTFCTCLVCAEIRSAFCCDGWTYTMLWEEAEEQMMPHLTTGCLDKLTTAKAKQKVLDVWRAWKFDE